MAKNKKWTGRSAIPLGAAALIGGGLLAALLSLRGSVRAARRGVDRDTGGHLPTDLALDRPHPGPGDRAPEAFRPDMDSPIAAEERGAFAPATMAPGGGAAIG